MIGMSVTDKNSTHTETGLEAHHLSLASLSTVEEEEIPLTLDGDAAHIPADGRSGRCGTEEGETNH
jgi:hypothetical protein